MRGKGGVGGLQKLCEPSATQARLRRGPSTGARRIQKINKQTGGYDCLGSMALHSQCGLALVHALAPLPARRPSRFSYLKIGISSWQGTDCWTDQVTMEGIVFSSPDAGGRPKERAKGSSLRPRPTIASDMFSDWQRGVSKRTAVTHLYPSFSAR